MKKSHRLQRSGRTARRRPLLLVRRAKVRKKLVRRWIVRKTRRGSGLKAGRYSTRGLLLSRKRRLRRRLARRRHKVQPAVQVIPVVDAQQAPQVIPLPPELGVPPETPPADAFQQGYTEAYNVGFDAGFAKGFEDGHKHELG
ncbi:hypothetical protein [Paenibacillus donghaensis]|uniref:Uncharacterized protein n=1 Tax=Paenibacillus donghaensis TaxID=414771 RepID=A0A2Z2KKM8_9BACL|nr:hypothetical protein [Paenibacillus donghaensis]ASA23910.1 hypothetical protein B9T62_25880 [Paenibacillus donghaensis]